MPTVALEDADFVDGEANILDVMVKAKAAKSKGEARRLIDQGGVSVDDVKVPNFTFAISKEALENAPVILKKGKKFFVKITL